MRDSDTDLDPAKRSSGAAAGKQEPSISIEDAIIDRPTGQVQMEGRPEGGESAAAASS